MVVYKRCFTDVMAVKRGEKCIFLRFSSEETTLNTYNYCK